MYPKRISSDGRAASKAKPQLEWQTCENENEWQLRHAAAAGDPESPPSPLSRWPLLRWRLVVVALMLFSGMLGWTWYQAQKGIAQIEGEIEESAVIELWKTSQAAQTSDSPFAIAELNGELPLTSTVELLAMNGEIATVRLTLPQGPEQPALRQTRLYQRTEAGWMQIAPTPVLWGSPRTRQTRYFDLHYYAQDEEAVAAVATTIDHLYESLTINFLSAATMPTATQAKITIRVDPAQSYGVIATRIRPTSPLMVAEPLVVASPAIYLSPVTISEEQLLAQSIMLSLLIESRGEAIQRYHSSEHWQGLIATLHLWQLWQLELPLAEWREPLVAWMLKSIEEPRSESDRHEPSFIAQLCAMHHLWMPSPRAIQIPLSCGGESWVDPLPRAGAAPAESPLTLASLIPKDPGPLQWYPLPPAYEGSGLVMTTLFDYVAAHYGKERLSIMVKSLPEHSSWETMVPAVFGVSASEFEQGWHYHLVEHNYLSCQAAHLQC